MLSLHRSGALLVLYIKHRPRMMRDEDVLIRKPVLRGKYVQRLFYPTAHSSLASTPHHVRRLSVLSFIDRLLRLSCGIARVVLVFLG